MPDARYNRIAEEPGGMQCEEWGARALLVSAFCHARNMAWARSESYTPSTASGIWHTRD